MENALQALNPWISELFSPVDFEYEAAETGAGLLPESFQSEWYLRVNDILEISTLSTISPEKKQREILSGKNGVHSEHLTDLLTEMQVLQRTYPGSAW
jgi:ring-1,2-phenylacetyl-CoA epoxidase subunit PaaC